jgi:hypothetical protein
VEFYYTPLAGRDQLRELILAGFILGNGVLATVKSVLVGASNQGIIPEALVWLFEGLCVPVFVWQVTGTRRSARRTEPQPEVC